jgi:mRNA interferase MazF
VIVSPDEINRHLRTVVVVPLTRRARSYRFRADTNFGGTPGQAAVDQIRTVDKARLRRRLGALSEPEARRLVAILSAFFAGEVAHR